MRYSNDLHWIEIFVVLVIVLGTALFGYKNYTSLKRCGAEGGIHYGTWPLNQCIKGTTIVPIPSTGRR